MAAHISAGVYWREIDLANYIPALSSSQFGIVGTASKGPINTRKLITTVDQLVKTFGYPAAAYPAIDAAMEYLKEGNQLWFVRAQSAATPAVAASISVTTTGAAFTLTAKDPGTFYNNIEALVSHGNARVIMDSVIADGILVTFALDLLPSGDVGRLIPGTVIVKSGSTVVATDDGAGALVEVGNSNVTGTVNYSTGVIAPTFDAAPADDVIINAEGQYYTTFSITFNKSIANTIYAVESYKNMNLDPNHGNYYQKVMASTQIVAMPTIAAFPLAGSYIMINGTDGTSGITDADYIGLNTGSSQTGLQLFSSADQVDVNCFAVPGISSPSVVQAMLTVAETRRDCIAIIDPPSGLDPQAVADWVDGKNAYDSQNSINSSYAAVYYPWVKVYDSYNRVERMIAPSGFVAACIARTDSVADIYYAPAGGSRGKLLGSIGTERGLSEGEREFLYQNRINPINDFVATGILIWGQKTTQVASTVLDRINARRTLNYIEKVCVTAAQPLVFEPNNVYTWARLVATVQPYLDSLVNKGALYEGKIVCSEITNPPDVIDRNEMVANIFLKITKTAEVITLNFVLLSTGAKIEEYIGRQF